MAAAGRSQERQRPQLLQAAISAIGQADIRAKLLFTFAMIVMYRFIANVPVPGVDPAALEIAFEQSTVLGFLNIFSGGALANMSVAAMGVYPYITSSIVMQLMVPTRPRAPGALERGRAGPQADQHLHSTG